MFEKSKSRPVNILLIEDNPGDIRLTKEVLKDSKVSIDLSVAVDGEEALDFLYKRGEFKEAATPDIILLDLNLPKKDGREILMDVKSDENLRRIPIVVLTTSNTTQDVLDCYNAYANCFICKPVDYDEFLNMIRKIEDFWLTTAILPTLY